MNLLDRPYNLNSLWTRVIINELYQSGVKYFYTSPGLRNAPIIESLHFLTNFYQDITIINGIDERAHSYRALGNAKETGQVTALVCTSGTAFLNYLPAITEAKKSGIPLLVISADRPEELIWSNANQTLEQENLLKQCFDHSFNCPSPNVQTPIRSIAYKTCNFINVLKNTNSTGHINLRFREPLDNSLDDTETNKHINESTLLSDYSSILKNKSSIVNYQYLNEYDLFKSQFINNNKSSKLLILVGDLSQFKLNEDETLRLTNMLKGINAPKYVDVTSKIKYNFSIEDQLIPSFEHPETYNILKNENFDFILHIGKGFTSKRISEFLSENKDESSQYYILNNNFELIDHSFTHQKHFATQSNAQLIESLSMLTQLEFENFNLSLKELVSSKEEVINHMEISFPFVSKAIVELTPTNGLLYLSNSMTIRSFDAYVSCNSTKHLNINFNRGVSGIEGFISSALGVADTFKTNKNSSPINLIIGDISFIYDLNSLFTHKHTSIPFNVIIMNNKGGGIFTHLSKDLSKKTLKQMVAPSENDFSFIGHLENQGIKYHQCLDKKSFINTYKAAQTSNGFKIIEVCLDTNIELAIYKQLKTIKI